MIPCFWHISKKILYWYDNNKRELPWRKYTSKKQKKYFTFVSEIMLQQTQVKTVIPYFNKFIKNWIFYMKNRVSKDFRDPPGPKKQPGSIEMRPRGWGSCFGMLFQGTPGAQKVKPGLDHGPAPGASDGKSISILAHSIACNLYSARRWRWRSEYP